jgi:hypothetical protein
VLSEDGKKIARDTDAWKLILKEAKVLHGHTASTEKKKN